jgi:uncharacterized protein
LKGDLVARTVAFCRALREQGFPLGVEHSRDAVRALASGTLESREAARLALRCVLVSRPEDLRLFDELFDDFFSAESAERPKGPSPKFPFPEAPRNDKEEPSLARWLRQGEENPDDDNPEQSPMASDMPALARKDFRDFTDEELSLIEQIAARIARKLAARPSRRWKAGRRGARVDLRRTMRSHPDLTELRFRERRTRKTRIVALCDVSGSMDLYSRFLLQFLYALQGSFARVESFVFSTELRRITESLRERPYASALRGLRNLVPDWSGGTRIGASLSTFESEWGRLVDRRTVVIVLSDGWDTGDPAELSRALEAIRMRSRRLIWLNPLLGSPGYEPLTQGMQAALPHLSVFASAHNLESLRALERHLLA